MSDPDPVDEASRSDHAEEILDVAFTAAHDMCESGWEEVLPDILRRLGEVTRVSRVYLYENTHLPDGRLAMDLHAEWVAPGIAPTIDHPAYHDYPYDEGFQRYVEVLSVGGVIHGLASELPAAEKEDLESQGIESTAVVPVHAGGEWWGYFGYDDCTQPRRWSALDIKALETTAAILGSAIRRERLEAEARANDLMMRSHLESLPLMTYLEIDDEESEGGYRDLYVGPQVEQIFGYTQDEWLNDLSEEEWAQHIHPDDRDWVMRVTGTTGAGRTGDPYAIEYRVRRKDGEYIWIREESHRGTVAEGMVPYWHGVIMDVTARKEAEEKLREAEEQFRSLVDNTPGVVYLDPLSYEEHTIYVSPKIEEVWGVTPEEYAGDPELWKVFLHPDDLERVELDEQAFLETGQPEATEYRVIRRDGRVVWIRDHATILRDADGEPVMIQGVMHDVTEAKAAEQERDFQAHLMENISDAVIAYDSEWTITCWNRAAQTLYGWPAEEMLGKPIPEELRYVADRSVTASVWDPFIQDSRGWIGKVVQHDRDGYELHVVTKGVPLRESDGSIRGFVMVNRESAEF